MPETEELAFKKFTIDDLDLITDIYALVFEENDFYQKAIGFSHKDLSVFFKSLHRLILEDSSNLILGIENDGKVISIGTFINPEWKPAITNMFGTFWEFSKGLGFSRANKIIKFIKIRDEFDDDLKNGWHIALFGTHPEYQRQGYGRKLLTNFLQENKDNGAYLDVLAGSVAEAFYANLGFNKAFQTKISGMDFCRMSL